MDALKCYTFIRQMRLVILNDERTYAFFGISHAVFIASDKLQQENVKNTAMTSNALNMYARWSAQNNQN